MRSRAMIGSKGKAGKRSTGTFCAMTNTTLTNLIGRRQRPCGISVVASSHITTPKLKMSALASHGKPKSTWNGKINTLAIHPLIPMLIMLHIWEQHWRQFSTSACRLNSVPVLQNSLFHYLLEAAKLACPNEIWLIQAWHVSNC